MFLSRSSSLRPSLKPPLSRFSFPLLRSLRRLSSPPLTVVAMSGGVDSSVAAHLLVERRLSLGLDPRSSVLGLHMTNWDAAEEGAECSASRERDLRDVRTTCDALGIGRREVSFVAEYWTEVFEPFAAGIAGGCAGAGVTPNPDFDCNARIKFGVMMRYAEERLGADVVATGHYARLWHRRGGDGWGEDFLELVRKGLEKSEEVEDNHWIEHWGNDARPTPLLLSGRDAKKDQSYFLSGVSGQSLRKACFPLGNLEKQSSPHDDAARSVRDIAAAAGLPAADKKDSVGICFVGKRKFRDFLLDYVDPPPPGDFVCVDTGRVVGRHDGAASLLTVGQGARIGGAGRKWYVVRKTGDGTVLVGDDTRHPALYADELWMERDAFRWTAGRPPPPLLDEGGGGLRALCRIRHQQPLLACDVRLCHRTGRLTLYFDKPMRAICPGQVAALYIAGGLICLGGGPIASAGLSYFDKGNTLPPELHPSGLNDQLVAVCN